MTMSPIVKNMKRDRRPINERRCSRVLSDDEIKILFDCTPKFGTYGVLVRCLLYTGQRL